MLAIGFGLAWVAYGHIVYAALLISGKNVSYRQVWSFTTWPPQSVGIACGKSGTSSTSSTSASSPASTAAPTGAQPGSTGQPLTAGSAAPGNRRYLT